MPAKNIKPNKHRMLRIIKHAQDLIYELNPTNYIVAQLCEKWDISQATAYRYIDRAMKAVEAGDKMDIEQTRKVHMQFLLKQLKKTIGGDPKHAQGWYDRLAKLFPNALAPKEEESEMTINVTYKKAEE